MGLSKFISNRKELFSFLLIFSLVIVDRFLLLSRFHFKFVGSDDLIFWIGAKDYSQGIYHEPYFYGQNYNFMVEALFAAPFVWIGIDFHILLPIISSVVSLAPFCIWALALYRKQHFVASSFFLALPILLPIEYSFLGSITRGFTSGLLLSVFLIPVILTPKSKRSLWWLWFAVFIGFILNPNSLVATVPVMTYAFLMNFRNAAFYALAVIVATPAFLIQFFARNFYELNPAYKVCQMWEIEYDIDMLFNNLLCLDCIFPYFTPMEWKHGWIGLLFILILGLILIKKDWRVGASMIVGVVFILFSLGINKVNDDANTILLSSSRMFLGIPLLLGISWYWASQVIKSSFSLMSPLIALLCLVTFFVKIWAYPSTLSSLHGEISKGPMPIKEVSMLCKECKTLKAISVKHETEIMVFHPTWSSGVPSREFYTYGCPIFETNFPTTLLTSYEKRTWIYTGESNKIFNNIMIYGSEFSNDKIESDTAITLISENPQIVALENKSGLDLRSLLETYGIQLKRNGY
jgi:hypothetical protein